MAELGIVGAGGGGFPAAVKLGARVPLVIANAAECEPLLHKDKELLHHLAAPFLHGMIQTMEMVGAFEGVIGIKEKYREIYSARRATVQQAQLNPAHFALARLEEKLGERFFLCTQNVDDLHERAGSKQLVHMHGELAKSRCERECGRPPVEDDAVYRGLDEVGRCACGGRLRPHIVFFGETPLEMERLQQEIESATLMLVVGTSGSVYPAANFVHSARRSGRGRYTSALSDR